MLRGILMFTGLLSLMYGIHMLAAPASWFRPAHSELSEPASTALFVRDVGMMYALSGAGILWAALNVTRSYPVVVMVALFHCGHGVIHAIDIAARPLPTMYWRGEFASVFLPAIVLGAIAWPSIWKKFYVFE